MDLAVQTFAAMFVEAARAKARYEGYEPPADSLVSAWMERLPSEVQAEIGRGLEAGFVLPAGGGHQFKLARLSSTKGPYTWFSANRAVGAPGPNWEYFYQVAEFLRLSRLLAPTYVLGFEDGLMDISVSHADRLIWYVEVKASGKKVEGMIRQLRAYGTGVPLDGPDRGNDSLRKAKYLVRHKPRFFSIVGGQERRHFDLRVEGATFELLERHSPESEL